MRGWRRGETVESERLTRGCWQYEESCASNRDRREMRGEEALKEITRPSVKVYVYFSRKHKLPTCKTINRSPRQTCWGGASSPSFVKPHFFALPPFLLFVLSFSCQPLEAWKKLRAVHKGSAKVRCMTREVEKEKNQKRKNNKWSNKKEANRKQARRNPVGGRGQHWWKMTFPTAWPPIKGLLHERLRWDWVNPKDAQLRV